MLRHRSSILKIDAPAPRSKTQRIRNNNFSEQTRTLPRRGYTDITNGSKKSESQPSRAVHVYIPFFEPQTRLTVLRALGPWARRGAHATPIPGADKAAKKNRGGRESGMIAAGHVLPGTRVMPRLGPRGLRSIGDECSPRSLYRLCIFYAGDIRRWIGERRGGMLVDPSPKIHGSSVFVIVGDFSF